MKILRRTKKAMMKATYGVNLIEKKKAKNFMSLLRLNDPLDGLCACEVQWYGHVLIRDNGGVLRRALDFEMTGRRGHERSNIMWKR